ncbi:MAG TPA: GGDEF domain-containing protein [Saprospiraceae bacterium]|nr:GGDEF domain-containing protein [Saprospiraceae bacterium]
MDGFKAVNDELGHQAGDRLLRKVARRLKDTLRSEDTAARIGGDEFALLIGELNTSGQCEYVLKRILDALATPDWVTFQRYMPAGSWATSVSTTSCGTPALSSTSRWSRRRPSALRSQTRALLERADRTWQVGRPESGWGEQEACRPGEEGAGGCAACHAFDCRGCVPSFPKTVSDRHTTGGISVLSMRSSESVTGRGRNALNVR